MGKVYTFYKTVNGKKIPYRVFANSKEDARKEFKRVAPSTKTIRSIHRKK